MKRIQGLFKVLKTDNSSMAKEEIGGRRTRGSGTRNLGGLSRENEDLHEDLFQSRMLYIEGHMA